MIYDTTSTHLTALMSATFSFTQKPTDAIEYLAAKGHKLTWNYTEMMHEAHHISFTVAKVTKLDLLSDIHSSLVTALEEGQSFNTWKKNIRPSLQEHGWYGKTEVFNPDTGKFKTITVGDRRLRTIFDTNMRTAYARASYKSAMASTNQYLRYSAVMDARTRERHRIAHGTILPKNDPWWASNYPPNGWHCRCKATSISNARLKAEGWSVSPRPPKIADKDWDYNVGDKHWFDGKYNLPCGGNGVNAKRDCTNTKDYKSEGLPDLRQIAKEFVLPSSGLLEAGETRAEGFHIAKKEILGDESSRLITTPLEQVLITDELLEHITQKEARERYARFIVPTLENPLEVWYTRFDDGNIRPQYIALFDEPVPMLISVVINRDGSLSWNATNSDIAKMNKKRVGEWFWKRY